MHEDKQQALVFPFTDECKVKGSCTKNLCIICLFLFCLFGPSHHSILIFPSIPRYNTNLIFFSISKMHTLFCFVYRRQKVI